MGDLDQALQDATRGIELMPDSAGAFFIRGMIRARRREFEDCIADCSRAIELDPGDPEIYELRAEAFREIGDEARAALDTQEAANLLSNKN